MVGSNQKYEIEGRDGKGELDLRSANDLEGAIFLNHRLRGDSDRYWNPGDIRLYQQD